MMHTLGIHRPMALIALVALGIASVLGCSSLPNAPFTFDDGPGIESRILRMQPAAERGGVTGVESGSTNVLAKTVKTVTGSTGGVVAAGRFSVVVPKDAFQGTGNITVEVPDSAMMIVDLHIEDVPNRFDVPVTLEVSFAGLDDDPDTSPEHFKIFWFDEEAHIWRMLPSTVDMQKRTVSTQLEHFSTYGVLEAKAGW